MEGYESSKLELSTELAGLGMTEELEGIDADEIERDIMDLGLGGSDSDYENDFDDDIDESATESATVGKLNLTMNSTKKPMASKRWGTPRQRSGIVSTSGNDGKIERIHSGHHSHFASANPAIASSAMLATSGSLAKPKSTAAKPPKWTSVKHDDIEMGPQIGGGGFALVYRARWNKRTVACKLLFDPNVDYKVRKEFNDELQVMAQLHHPNIVQLIGANDKPPKMFILMELCEDSLYTLLHGSKAALSQRTCGQFLLDIALGLEHMHSRQPFVIHRDLKSQNVLVQGTTLKLCDFGLAGSHVSTAGTPSYMAPELFSGRPFTKAVDVYAFAMLAWEIFAREIPFHGYSIVDIKNMCLANKRPACPSSDFPDSIRALLARAWAHKSPQRPPMKEIVPLLQRLVPTLWADSAAAVGLDALDAMLNL